MSRMGILFVVVLCSVLVGKEPASSARSKRAIAKVQPALEVRLAEIGAQWGSPVFLQLFKEEKELEVWIRGRSDWILLDTFPICYFSGELGPKKKEGDLQAPEGFYRVTPDLMNPWSSYHLSFNVGYPNRFDRKHGYTGSLIMIHGNCVSIGCFAMTDEVIEPIYALLDAYLRTDAKAVNVHIYPFRMTEARWRKAKETSNAAHLLFWEQLKPAYDYFQKQKSPPRIKVMGKRYLVEDIGE